MGRGNGVLKQDGCKPINLDFVRHIVFGANMDDAKGPLDPVIALVLTYCPATIRPAWRWLWMLQKKINDGAARTGEPMLAQMRIAWWRDRILDEAALSTQRDPMLLELADLMAQHPKLPGIAVRLLDRIEGRITADTPSAWVQAVGEEGAILASSYAELAGIDGNASEVGRAFRCACMLVHDLPHADERWQLARDLVEEAMTAATGVRLPRSLSLMQLYASRILANPHGQARRRDGMKLVIHGLTGWPKY